MKYKGVHPQLCNGSFIEVEGKKFPVSPEGKIRVRRVNGKIVVPNQDEFMNEMSISEEDIKYNNFVFHIRNIVDRIVVQFEDRYQNQWREYLGSTFIGIFMRQPEDSFYKINWNQKLEELVDSICAGKTSEREINDVIFSQMVGG